MGQEGGEKRAAAADLQLTLPKSDRLLGFLCEGLLREVARFKGQQHDMQQWALLRSDHLKAR